MDSIYEDYGLLLKRFIQNEISAEEFQRKYLDQFKNETRELDEPLFQLLDTLFGDVDAFCADPKTRAELEKQKPGFYLDENQLRQRATEVHERLASRQQDSLHRPDPTSR